MIKTTAHKYLDEVISSLQKAIPAATHLNDDIRDLKLNNDKVVLLNKMLIQTLNQYCRVRWDLINAGITRKL